MQQHNSDNQTVDVQGTSSVNAPQMQPQQLQVIPPARAAVDLSGAGHQGVLYQDGMQNLHSPQSFPPQGSAANTMNAQQQITDWTGDGRFVPQVRYSSTLQPVYDFRGQLLAPANLALHPANVNQLVQYAYGTPQQRPGQGPVTQFTPWQTIFTPNQGLAWVPGGIQGTTIEGQGNQIVSRNLQHDTQPGIFIHNGQAQLQLKQMDGQHVAIPKTAISENFSPTLPNSVCTVNNMRTQQQSQIQALQAMLQSQKVDAKALAKNPLRLTTSTAAQKNSAYHTNAATSLSYPLPPVHGSSPGKVTRATPSFSTLDIKRMKQSQAPEEPSRKEPAPHQQAQKRYQQMQANLGSVPSVIPATHEGAALPVRPTTPLLRNMIQESVTGVSTTIQILPRTPVSQGMLANSTPVITTTQQQTEKQDAEHKKRIQQPKSSNNAKDRSEEPQGSVGDLGKYMKEKSNSKQKALTEAEEISEDMDVEGRGDKDNNATTLSKATVLVKPQIMTYAAEGTSEPISSCMDGEDDPMKSEADGNIVEDDGKEVNRKANADSGKESFPSVNKQQTKPNLSKWTVADVYEFIRTVPGCSEYAEDFVAHDIDGEALLLLKTDHLVTAMSMTLGPAMKIISRIDAMREDPGTPAK